MDLIGCWPLVFVIPGLVPGTNTTAGAAIGPQHKAGDDETVDPGLRSIVHPIALGRETLTPWSRDHAPRPASPSVQLGALEEVRPRLRAHADLPVLTFALQVQPYLGPGTAG